MTQNSNSPPPAPPSPPPSTATADAMSKTGRPTPGNNKAAKKKRRRDKRQPLTCEEIEQIVRLHKMCFGTRSIATKVGVGRKQVRTLLESRGLHKQAAGKQREQAARRASKLDGFRDAIQQKVKAQLTTTRILREIRQDGYTGGRSILNNYVNTLRTAPVPKKKVWRRFETRPGQEVQFDWSPYRVSIAGKMRTVHAFAATLGYCRKSYIHFYCDERQPTLLEAHCNAFEDFGGVCQRGVYDRMSTVVLGTIGKDRKPLWHPRFVDFCKYYGYEPYLCKRADPDRKGKDERIFWYMERDFMRASSFDSMQDLNIQVRFWLDTVANIRIHGTTRRVPDEVWKEEQPFLIPLPETRFVTGAEEGRSVGKDSVIWVRGTPYTIPAKITKQSSSVGVRLYAEHFEVLDNRGNVAFSRPYAPEHKKGRLDPDASHYEEVHPRGPLAGGSVADLEDALLTRFPTLAELCAGVRLRMKSLSHIHLRALWRLADRWGDEAFVAAASQAQRYRRFNAEAVRRILERQYPLPDEPEPINPLTATARVLVEIGDVDCGSLDDYAELDGAGSTDEPTEKPTEGGQDDDD
jgi:transposase